MSCAVRVGEAFAISCAVRVGVALAVRARYLLARDSICRSIGGLTMTKQSGLWASRYWKYLLAGVIQSLFA